MRNILRRSPPKGNVEGAEAGIFWTSTRKNSTKNTLAGAHLHTRHVVLAFFFLSKKGEIMCVVDIIVSGWAGIEREKNVYYKGFLVGGKPKVGTSLLFLDLPFPYPNCLFLPLLSPRGEQQKRSFQFMDNFADWTTF